MGAVASTTYTNSGAPVLSSSMCDDEVIDVPTQKALADAKAIANALAR